VFNFILEGGFKMISIEARMIDLLMSSRRLTLPDGMVAMFLQGLTIGDIAV
jgi:hypothetical protein